jgi:hypothetical protein
VGVGAGLALGAAVVLAATALGAPAGSYAGTTTEHGAVTFSVVGHAVRNFTVQDGYNGGCDFSGGVGGIRTYSVTIKSMAVARSGRFSGRVTESNAPFSGSAVLAVTGRFTGAKAFGTVTAVGRNCGTDSPTPGASMYYESYSATRR